MKRFDIFRPFLVALLAGIFLGPVSLPAARVAGDPGGHTNRGVKYAKKKEYEKAVEEFTMAIELQPKDPRNYRNRAITYRLMGEQGKAKADFAKAIELNPDTPKSLTDNARLLLRDKKTKEALAQLDKALEIDPRNRPALRLRGYIYLQQGQWKKRSRITTSRSTSSAKWMSRGDPGAALPIAT